MPIIHVTKQNADLWAQLCNELWPHHSAHEMLKAFDNGEYPSEYLYQMHDIPVAFLSLSLRNDYVEGKEGTGPVGYIEGIYVTPEYRKRGVAKELVAFAKSWSAQRGCTMLASDCEINSKGSRAFHNRIGFAEAGINVHFIMELEK